MTPHDPLDDLIAAALQGELSPEERAQLDVRLKNDPAAQAAYEKAQLMHTMLNDGFHIARPDSAFEQRMVSGVRRKIQTEARRETAWESVLFLWRIVRGVPLRPGRVSRPLGFVLVLGVIVVLAGVTLGPITSGIKSAKQNAEMQAARANGLADAEAQMEPSVNAPQVVSAPPASPPMGDLPQDGQLFAEKRRNAGQRLFLRGANTYTGGSTISGGNLKMQEEKAVESGGIVDANSDDASQVTQRVPQSPQAQPMQQVLARNEQINRAVPAVTDTSSSPPTTTTIPSPVTAPSTPPADTAPPAIDTRKLIRNARLDLEVKSFQDSMDKIAELTKAAGGYVDTSSSQKGGNGKLQGEVVVKVLPANLDDFLLKLRDLGQIRNQSVSTDDVTKDYYDTEARLDNSRKLEIQLQELLKRTNGKVAELLEVERELGRVRGQIEQMQGSLKMYDFQVAYATVTIQLREKDLNQAAAYLLKEQDNFSLFATEVEATFQKARQVADDFKAQILAANLNHNSGSDVSAELVVMVAPDQIEPFLTQIRALGRVDNFTRQTQRVAKDGGDSDQPADETLTEKDKVEVHLTIRSDDETRKQVALTVVTPAVDTALDQAKSAALAQAGTEILGSSLSKAPEGQSTARLNVRVPGQSYNALLEAFHALGRTASLSIQREDNSGPGANGDDAPVIVSLSLTDEDTPMQQTEISVLASEVDAQAQQIKKSAGDAGVEVKASSYGRQPDGTETAQMTFRLSMAKYAPFLETLKNLGKVESLTVRRDDRPDQTRVDDTAPVEISFTLHNQRDLVADDGGLWATLRQTFGEGAGALFTSIRTIGVLVAFLTPWVIAFGIAAWIGRRIYLWRKR